MSIWNETSGANRIVMLVCGTLSIGLLFGGLTYGTSMLQKKSVTRSTTTTTEVAAPSNNYTTPVTTPRVATTVPLTTTTLFGGDTQQMLQTPEAGVRDGNQLAYLYNQPNSGLSTVAYQRAVDVAKQFNLAEATGQGANNFAPYFSERPADPWVKNYKLVYATVIKTDDPTIVKAIVWFTGTEKASGLPMTQVKEGFFLKRSARDSLDFSPMLVVGLPDDSDWGIQVLT